MSTQFSPDGRWFWDGQQWQPVQPSPPGGPPRRTGLVVLLAVLAVLALAVPIGVYGFREWRQDDSSTGPEPGGDTPTQQPTSSAPAETIRPGEPVTKDRLAKVSAAAFYWELLERQMTRPVSVITSATFRTPADFDAHQRYNVVQTGIDHRTKKLGFASTSYTDGKPDWQVRCVGGKAYSRFDTPAWTHTKSSDRDCGGFSILNKAAATDNIVASGLNADQAGKVIATLRDEYDEFAHPSQPTLLSAGGKTYVRQVVDFKPVKLADGQYWGTQIFTWAFKASGLDPDTWPWFAGLAPGAGAHVVYYLDPQTLLPVATTMRTTPTLDNAGNVAEDFKQTAVFNYQFPTALPTLTLTDPRPITLTFPEGWRITP